MNNTDHRYQLESPRLTGHRQQKTTCPECGRRHCFVRYVDTEHDCQYLADDVGRCDHEQSCGYHYKPAQYFHDHPTLTMSDRSYQLPTTAKTLHISPAKRPFTPLDPTYVKRSHSTASVFWQWFATDCARQLQLTRQDLDRVYRDYMPGATRDGNVIFWQTDQQQRVHAGHVMRYLSNGHRQGYQCWVHWLLAQQKVLPTDYDMQQCLYGLHLLPARPDVPVAIVESEKTALIMAARYPDMLWMATSGSGGLSTEKLLPLMGSRLIIFPDSGCLQKWSDRMKISGHTDYIVYTGMEHYPPNTDLADIILGET